MRTRPLHLAVSVLLVALVAACAGPGDGLRERAVEGAQDGLERARDAIDDLSDDARFCLAVTRTVAAIESGSPATAEEAAEEVLAQAPEGLVEPARGVVDELRRVLSNGGDLRAPELGDAVDQLLDAAADRCDPR
ncbi:MAG: hypothetical protein ACNA8R_12915 [Nitriliruptoraceae bacterium]